MDLYIRNGNLWVWAGLSKLRPKSTSFKESLGSSKDRINLDRPDGFLKLIIKFFN